MSVDDEDWEIASDDSHDEGYSSSDAEEDSPPEKHTIPSAPPPKLKRTAQQGEGGEIWRSIELLLTEKEKRSFELSVGELLARRRADKLKSSSAEKLPAPPLSSSSATATPVGRQHKQIRNRIKVGDGEEEVDEELILSAMEMSLSGHGSKIEEKDAADQETQKEGEDAKQEDNNKKDDEKEVIRKRLEQARALLMERRQSTRAMSGSPPSTSSSAGSSTTSSASSSMVLKRANSAPSFVNELEQQRILQRQKQQQLELLKEKSRNEVEVNSSRQSWKAAASDKTERKSLLLAQQQLHQQLQLPSSPPSSSSSSTSSGSGAATHTKRRSETVNGRHFVELHKYIGRWKKRRIRFTVAIPNLNCVVGQELVINVGIENESQVIVQAIRAKLFARDKIAVANSGSFIDSPQQQQQQHQEKEKEKKSKKDKDAFVIGSPTGFQKVTDPSSHAATTIPTPTSPTPSGKGTFSKSFPKAVTRSVRGNKSQKKEEIVIGSPTGFQKLSGNSPSSPSSPPTSLTPSASSPPSSSSSSSQQPTFSINLSRGPRKEGPRVSTARAARAQQQQQLSTRTSSTSSSTTTEVPDHLTHLVSPRGTHSLRGRKEGTTSSPPSPTSASLAPSLVLAQQEVQVAMGASSEGGAVAALQTEVRLKVAVDDPKVKADKEAWCFQLRVECVIQKHKPIIAKVPLSIRFLN
ncbi:hypothetical protein QOT17_000522 [Balamuthia mandrillaris]